MVRVGDLLREPGSRRSVERSVDPATLAGGSNLETSSARTIPGTDVTVHGEVMAMAGGVELVGEVGFDWYGGCRRCLDEVHGHQSVAFREVAQREPVDDEVLPIEGDVVDLEPLVRELVLAGMPLAPLCADDCAGPDPERFPTTTEEEVAAERAAEDAEAEPVRDPRWAALDDLDLEG